MKFVERRPIEVGFAKVFETEVWPQLTKLETDRKAELRKAIRNIALVLILGGGLAWLSYTVLEEKNAQVGALFVGCFTFAGVVASWRTAALKWSSAVAEVIVPAVCKHVGDLRYTVHGNGFLVSPFRDLRLVPSFDESHRTHRFQGTYRGTGYEMVQVSLSKQKTNLKGRQRTQVRFTGLLFRIDMPVTAPGRIVLMRDRGALGNKVAEKFAFGSTRSLPKVTFDHADFERAFEVYAEDPEATRAFMPDLFLEALLTIAKEQGEGRQEDAFVAGFERQNFYLALKRSKPMIQLGKLTRPVSDMQGDLRGIFDDISIPHRIIDRLHGV